MSEPTAPPPPPTDPPEPPSPPPASGPDPAPPPPPSGGSENKTIMLVLAYLWILALIPLLVEKEDKEVQWHAKHGLVLLAAEIIFWVAVTVITFIPGLGLLGCLSPLVWLAFLVLRVICIVKAVNGQRMLIPGLSQYADKF